LISSANKFLFVALQFNSQLLTCSLHHSSA
jgi:hypothetical protein